MGVSCVSQLSCVVCMFLVDVVFLGHITAAFVQEGGANLMFDRGELTQTLSTMFHNVSQEVPGQLTAVEQMCTLVFQLFDRCGHNESRVHLKIHDTKGIKHSPSDQYQFP